jgi:spermidine/putrescine transport system ATP-binding protein
LDAAPGSKVQILLRPEDLRISEDIKEDMPRLPGTIMERSYRGATLDTTIHLDHGPIVQACEFFDEDDPDFDYSIGERVEVSWVRGWEVLLRDEE